MKIKFRYIYTLFTIMLATSMVSCEDMLNTDSDRLAFEEDHTIGSPNDSVYSAMGILSQVQRIGERYVLFGELRGDLMSATQYAAVDLQGIGNFQISADNAYKDKYDYYSIINNCNYAISRMDTSIVLNNQKAMLPEFVAIKTIRAWTYMQMVQAFGKATYFEKPILSLEESLAEYPEVNMDDLATLLVKDLLPFSNVRHLDYGQIDEQASARFFVPIKMLLGDLFLYQNNYEQAATMYHDLIYANKITIFSYANRWTKSDQSTHDGAHVKSYAEETLMKIPYSKNPKDFHSNLIKLTYSNSPSLLPTKNYMDKMATAVYFYAEELTSAILAQYEGDLRGTMKGKYLQDRGDAYQLLTKSKAAVPLVTKFFNAGKEDAGVFDPDPNALLEIPRILRAITVYTNQEVFLRYAEAVNRAGKPTLAFSILKYGLSQDNILNPNRVNFNEIKNMEPYINFGLDNNTEFSIGMAVRGRGLGIPSDKVDFIIPNYTRYVGGVPSTEASDIAAARQDTINWVELAVLDEMAAETAFNGNRFFDLLRMSRRRANHPEFMATKVAAKYSDPASMKARLKNMDAWYIK